MASAWRGWARARRWARWPTWRRVRTCACHSADIIVSEPCTTISFTPETLTQLSAESRMRFDKAFIQVLVRRLHAAHETLAHPRRVL